MSRIPSVALATALCLLVWVLALGSASPGDLLVGVAVVLAVLLGPCRRAFARPAMGAAAVLRRTAAFVPFALCVAWQIVVGTWRVAMVVVGIRQPAACGILVVPMEERSDLGVAVTGLVLSLTPGENLLDLDWERRLMIVHALDACDPEEVRRSQRRFYERFQRPVFP